VVRETTTLNGNSLSLFSSIKLRFINTFIALYIESTLAFICARELIILTQDDADEEFEEDFLIVELTDDDEEEK